MQIGVIGVNHKLADVALREMVARACQRRFFLENPLENGSFVLLSTCNRSELYFSAPSLVEAHQEILSILKEEIADEFEQKLYTFFGFDCFLHLAKVTVGLDSAIIAETEIQGQVKGAYEAATELRSLSKELHFLFQKCLKIGKETRTQYVLEKSLPDLEHALFAFSSQFFGKLPRVLFIGASEINNKIASFLLRKGVEFTFCNRSKENIAFDCEILEWQELNDKWQEFDWVISATKSPHYLLVKNGLPLTKQKLLVDLAIPRNIDPLLEEYNVRLLNIDQLQQLLEKRRSLLQEQLIHLNYHLSSLVLRQIRAFKAKCQIESFTHSYPVGT